MSNNLPYLQAHKERKENIMVKLSDILAINSYSKLVIKKIDEEAPLDVIFEDSYKYIVKGFHVFDDVLCLYVEKMGECKIYRIK